MAVRGLPAVDAYVEKQYQEKFYAAMDDDFNTPEALAVLFSIAHEINRLKEQSQIAPAVQLAATLKQLADIFGFLKEDPEIFLQGGIDDAQGAEIEALIAARNQARAQKDWAEADRIRAKLQAMNIFIEDNATGTTWRRGDLL